IDIDNVWSRHDDPTRQKSRSRIITLTARFRNCKGGVTLLSFMVPLPFIQLCARPREEAVVLANFDPYHKWLGIPKDQRPPTLYQLLGVSPQETDAEVL